jgi:phage baseplate assembly protein gpV
MSASKIAQMIGHLHHRIEELERRHANLMRPGKVTEVDHAKGLVKVKVGDLDSQWVPWTETAGAIKTWTPPSVGQQVHLFSPSGEPGQGWVMAAGFSDENTQPHDKGAEHKFVIGDTSVFLTGAKAVITATDIEFNGKVQVNGTQIKHNTKNIGDDHKHTGVTPGGGITDIPV